MFEKFLTDIGRIATALETLAEAAKGAKPQEVVKAEDKPARARRRTNAEPNDAEKAEQKVAEVVPKAVGDVAQPVTEPDAVAAEKAAAAVAQQQAQPGLPTEKQRAWYKAKMEPVARELAALGDQGRQAVVDLLTRHGAPRLSALPTDVWHDVHDELTKALESLKAGNGASDLF